MTKNANFYRVDRRDFLLLSIGALLVFFLASLLMNGMKVGFFPNIYYPFIATDDGAFSAIQRVIEGWVTTNHRSGYPFGSNWSDFANADGLNFIFIKFLSVFSEKWWVIHNLYFLLGFPLVFISSYIGFRYSGLNITFAFVASFTFTFLPFHFQRIAHLYYTNYLHVPIFWFIALSIFRAPEAFDVSRLGYKKIIFYSLILIGLGSLGVYFALFGLILIFFSGVFSSLILKNFIPIRAVIIVSLPIFFGLMVNLSPTLFDRYTHGANLEVAHRSATESEIYAFKLAQLIMPRANHRNAKLASYSDHYAENSIMVNENRTSSIGFIGSLGFIIALCLIFTACTGNKSNREMNLISVLVLILFLFGTIGGFGSLFSLLVTTSFRGWNRISIFIAYGSLLVFFLFIQAQLKSIFTQKTLHLNSIPILIAILGLAFYDQTTSPCVACNENIKKEFDIKKNFIGEIEAALPSGAAIYQLPYIPFPEVPPLNDLKAYDSFDGFLYSKKLKWSYATMKGRQGDLFFRALSNEPIEKQISVIKKMGFSGVYLDLRAYPQSDRVVYDKLKKALGTPTCIRVDNKAVFFRLDSDGFDASVLSPENIMIRSGYYVDNLGVRYQAELSDPLIFGSTNYPSYIHSISGLSDKESWGRWSDANLQSYVRIKFFDLLPMKFKLRLKLQTYPASDKLLPIAISGKQYLIHLKPGLSSYEIVVNKDGFETNYIDFYPQGAVSPEQLGVSADKRKISVGFVQLQVVQGYN